MNISAENLRAVKDGQPLRFVEPAGTELVSARADEFDRARSISDAADFDPREAMPMIWHAMKDDWEDPAMDVYDQKTE